MSAHVLRCHGEDLAVGKIAEDVDLGAVSGPPLCATLETGTDRTAVFPYRHRGRVGADAFVEGPFRAFEVHGPLDFSLTGVLSGVLEPLARAEISVFTLSTFDTDWILVPSTSREPAVAALRSAGHTVVSVSSEESS